MFKHFCLLLGINIYLLRGSLVETSKIKNMEIIAYFKFSRPFKLSFKLWKCVSLAIERKTKQIHLSKKEKTISIEK